MKHLCNPILLILLVSIFVCNESFSSHGKPHLRYGVSDPLTYEDPIILLTSEGVPLSPVQEGVQELRISPAYVNYYGKEGGGGDISPGQTDLSSIDVSSDATDAAWSENEAKGGGFNISWFKGLKNGWGYSILFSYLHMKGTTFAWAEYDGSGDLLRSQHTDEKGDSFETMGFMIYDPYHDSDDYSVPLFFGLGLIYSNVRATLEKTVNGIDGLSGNPKVKWESKFKKLYPGLVLGGAFQFDVGDFFFSPYLALLIRPVSITSSPTVENLDTGEKLFTNPPNLESDLISPSAGLAVEYVPWGVDVKWIPNVFKLLYPDENFGGSVWTISKSWSWDNDSSKIKN